MINYTTMFMTIMINSKPSMQCNFSAVYKAALLITLLCITSFPIFAKDYMVEVLVYENLDAGRAYEPHTYEAPQAMSSNRETWKIQPSMLIDAANAITNSSSYHLLHHYSWAQESLPYSQSAAFQVVEQNMNGWFKIYATQLLFANIDIDFNGYRMNEVRRLKLNEKHFFDHPKFGILIQVSRLEAE